MHVLIILSAFVVICCFGLAVYAKARDISAFRTSLSSFGFSSSGQSAVTIAVLAAESLTLLTLLLLPLQWGGAISLLLLTAFTIASGAALLQGRQPQCQCFGKFSTDRIGWQTILRNVVMAGFAAVLVTEQQTLLTVIESSDAQTLVMSGMAIVIAGLMMVLYMLLTRYGEALHTLNALRVDDATRMPGKGPEPGLPPPDLTLLDWDHHPVELIETLSDSKSMALVLLSTTCGQCEEVVSLLETAADNSISGVVVIRGELNGNVERFRGLQRTSWRVFFTDADLNNRFRIAGFPALVPLDKQGKVKEEALLGKQRIEAFLANPSNIEASHIEKEMTHDQHVGENTGTAAQGISAD